MQVDGQRLADLVRERRDARSYRVAALEAGVSASMLCRVEHRAVSPGFGTIRKLCGWVGIRPSDLILDGDVAEDEPDTPTRIEALLRDDPLLDPQDARAIAQIVRLAYAEAARRTLSGGDED